MNRISKYGLSAVAGLALTVSTASANSITITNLGIPAGPGTWTFSATQSNGTLDQGAGTSGNAPFGTFITIYDFEGYVDNSAFAPDVDGDGFFTDDWAFTYQNLGLTPTEPNVGVQIVDNPGIGNLVWQYIGAPGASLKVPSIADPNPNVFGATSTRPPLSLSYFSTQDKSGTSGADESVVASQINVPAVPEGGSALVLLGLAFAGVEGMRRKFRVS
jgi:hypothetical protein